MKKTGMNRLIIATIAFACGLATYAMPTKQELVQAQSLVQTLTADDLRALQSKEKAPGDVAAAQLALADKAETEAGKYLLLQGAFRLYARSEDYDSAAEVLQRMRGEIAELPPEVLVEIVNREMRRVAAEKAPKVLAIFRDAQRMIKYRKLLASVEAAAKSKPGDSMSQRRLAECHACLGDWQKALPIFAKLGDEAAKWELGKSKGCDAAKAADFWWNYKTADAEPFEAHAASLYRAALDANQISGLKREVAAKRLAEFEASGAAVMVAATGGQKASAPTTGPWAIPANLKEPLVRTLKLANGVDMDFCAIPAGTFKMANDGNGDHSVGGCHTVTITRPFWFSKSLVTARQFVEITPTNAEMEANVKEIEKLFPEFYVCHECLQEDADLFLKGLNKKFAAMLPKGYVFRLPTDAEWEYVLYGDCEGDDRRRKVYWRGKKDDGRLYDTKNVKWRECRLMPRNQFNKWGVVGWGTGEQMILDKISVQGGGFFTRIPYNAEEVDPLREGDRYLTRIAYAVHGQRTQQHTCLFRVVIGPDLVAEKKGSKAANPAPVLAPPVVHQAQNTTPPAKIKTHTIKLNNTVSIEFVECPAGTFTMGYEKGEYSPNREHKVTITRPFWIARTKLTLEQYKACNKKFMPREDFLIDGDKSPLCATHLSKWNRRVALRRQAENICEYLTKKFRHAIPKGYVFRLPTDAEWEYAYTAGETNPDDFYGMSGNATKRLAKEELEKYMITSKYIQEYAAKVGKNYGKGYDETGVAVGKCKPNRWGLYDMAGNTCEMVLDTLDAKLLDIKGWYGGLGPKQTALVYKDEEVDPLRYIPTDPANDGQGLGLCKTVEMASRGGDGGKWRRTGFQHSFRLVVGPDLLKERGIKMPKLGK